MSKPKPRPGKLVTVRVTPAVAAKLEADARKARVFNKGIAAALRVVAEHRRTYAADVVIDAALAALARDILNASKPEA